jgi:hypothetical protein
MECQDVDPASRAVASDLDLACNVPAGPLETSSHVPDASDVRRVALQPALAKVGPINVDQQSSAYSLEKSSRGGEAQPGEFPRLDPRDDRLRRTGPSSQLSLTPAEGRSELAYDIGNIEDRLLSGPGITHAAFIAQRPSLRIICGSPGFAPSYRCTE